MTLLLQFTNCFLYVFTHITIIWMCTFNQSSINIKNTAFITYLITKNFIFILIISFNQFYFLLCRIYSMLINFFINSWNIFSIYYSYLLYQRMLNLYHHLITIHNNFHILHHFFHYRLQQYF